MSLKAKIEAVIYAAEEPVTLAQLVGLLGQQAQAEMAREGGEQQPLLLEGIAEEREPSEDADATAEPVEVAEAEPAADLTPTAELDAQAERQAARAERSRQAVLRDHFRRVLEELVTDYATGDRGLEVREVAGGYRLATKPEYHDAVRGFVRSLKPPLKLTLQALETLAVVAYKQPVTAPEVSEIRGVDSSGVLGSLMARKLVATAGRKQVIGRPILYRTTKDFLLRFGLKDLAELPSIEEFEKMAAELAEAEPQQEEIALPMNTTPEAPRSITGANLEEEREATEPQADGDGAALEEVPVDGRVSGPPPPYDEQDPSALEAEVQSGGEAP